MNLMKQISNHHLNNKARSNHQFKLSSIALIMSTTLIGYGLTPVSSAEAKDKTDLNIETHLDNAQSLEKHIQAGKEKIEKLKHIKGSQKQAAIQDMTDAKSIEEVKEILKKVKNDKNETIKEHKENKASAKDEGQDDATIEEENKHTSSEGKENVEYALDDRKQPIANKENFTHSEPTDNKALINQDNSQAQTSDVRTPSKDTKQNIDQLVDDVVTLSNKVDGGKLNDRPKVSQEAKDSEEEGNPTTISEKDNNTVEGNDPNSGVLKNTSYAEHNPTPQLEAIKKDIDKVMTSHSQAKDHLDDYVENKAANLQTLESKLSERDSISAENKEKLKAEIKQTEQSLKEQDDIVLNHLKSVDNKEQAVKNIVNDTFDEKRAQSILERIDTDGKTDQQIASQVISQLDDLSTTTSDDILQSMFNETTDKEALIKTILSTQLDHTDASEIAEKIMHDNPTNDQIVALMKHYFGDNVTSDDILEQILDQSQNKRKALETMLATQLNDAKAKALADVIAKKEDAKHNLVDLMKSGVDQQLNDLLKVDKDISQFKENIHGIFEPLKHTPNLSNTLSGSLLDKDIETPTLGNDVQRFETPSLLSGLLSGHNILDGVRDIPNPSPGRALSLGGSEGFLSGLFDDEGNFSLPDAGTVAKKSTILFGVVLLAVGGGLIWFAKRKKSKES